MMEILKKIGIPATVAAIISVLVTVTPFLFKIDDRYAKAHQLQLAIEKNDAKTRILTAEIAKLAGVTEVLVAVISQEHLSRLYYPRALASEPEDAALPSSRRPANSAQPVKYNDMPSLAAQGVLTTLSEARDQLRKSQEKLQQIED